MRPATPRQPSRSSCSTAGRRASSRTIAATSTLPSSTRASGSTRSGRSWRSSRPVRRSGRRLKYAEALGLAADVEAVAVVALERAGDRAAPEALRVDERAEHLARARDLAEESMPRIAVRAHLATRQDDAADVGALEVGGVDSRRGPASGERPGDRPREPARIGLRGVRGHGEPDRDQPGEEE